MANLRYPQGFTSTEVYDFQQPIQDYAQGNYNPEEYRQPQPSLPTGTRTGTEVQGPKTAPQQSVQGSQGSPSELERIRLEMQQQQSQPQPIDYTRGLHDESTREADAAAGWTRYNDIDVRPGTNIDEIRRRLQQMSDAEEQKAGSSADYYNESDLGGVLRNIGRDSPRTLEDMYAEFARKYANTGADGPDWNTGRGGGGGGYSGGGGGGGSSSGGGGGSSGSFGGTDIKDILKGLFPGGAFNQDIVTGRTSNARDTLERQRKQQLATQRASMAQRGLLGSGPEATGYNNLEGRLGDQYANAVTGIYADESENADSRMIQALSLATGMSEGEAARALQKELGMADIDLRRELGHGNLALGNMGMMNDYNLGMGRLGLDRERLGWDQENTELDRLIRLIEQLDTGGR